MSFSFYFHMGNWTDAVFSFVNRHVPGDPSVPGSPPTQADWDIIADHIVTIDRDPELYAQFFKHTNALNEAPEREKYDDDTSFEVSSFFVLLLFARTDVLFCLIQLGVDYPNEPFPQIDRPVAEQIGAGAGATREAVWRLRDLFRAKLDERDAWELRTKAPKAEVPDERLAKADVTTAPKH